jgi:hypothetical protein
MIEVAAGKCRRSGPASIDLVAGLVILANLTALTNKAERQGAWRASAAGRSRGSLALALHLGLWFNSPQDAAAAGCPNGVTPFNGDHTAGIQILSTRNFVDIGPLSQLTP